MTHTAKHVLDPSPTIFAKKRLRWGKITTWSGLEINLSIWGLGCVPFHPANVVYLDKLEVWAAGGATGKVRGSSTSVCFILWEPQISFLKFHCVQSSNCWDTSALTKEVLTTSIAVPSATPLAWLQNINSCNLWKNNCRSIIYKCNCYLLAWSLTASPRRSNWALTGHLTYFQLI